MFMMMIISALFMTALVGAILSFIAQSITGKGSKNHICRHATIAPIALFCTFSGQFCRASAASAYREGSKARQMGQGESLTTSVYGHLFSYYTIFIDPIAHNGCINLAG